MPSWTSCGGRASATSVCSCVMTTSTSYPGMSSTNSRLCQLSVAWPGTSASSSTTLMTRVRTMRRPSLVRPSPLRPSLLRPSPTSQTPLCLQWPSLALRPEPHPAPQGFWRITRQIHQPSTTSLFSSGRPHLLESQCQPLLSQPHLLTLPPAPCVRTAPPAPAPLPPAPQSQRFLRLASSPAQKLPSTAAPPAGPLISRNNLPLGPLLSQVG